LFNDHRNNSENYTALGKVTIQDGGGVALRFRVRRLFIKTCRHDTDFLNAKVKVKMRTEAKMSLCLDPVHRGVGIQAVFVTLQLLVPTILRVRSQGKETKKKI
jgi:hypothetical protein